MMGGSTRPRAKVGDFEKALELMAATGADKDTKAYLIELRDATLAHDKAKAEAEAMIAEAGRREVVAHTAEDDVRSQRAALKTETAESDRRLSAERATQRTEANRLLALTGELERQVEDLNQREDALRRAFDAYTKEE